LYTITFDAAGTKLRLLIFRGFSLNLVTFFYTFRL